MTTQSAHSAPFDQTFPLRVARTTTGTVHAAREYQSEILDFNKPYAERRTGRFETRIAKACGCDPNTWRRVAGTAGTDAPVTCKKCLKIAANWTPTNSTTEGK